MKKLIILSAILFIACAVLSLQLDATRPSPPDVGVGKVSDSTRILLGMLGEVRYTLAAFIWLKADAYHHEYELYGKDWKTNKALMSLIRLVTDLDPHFIQAYDFGSYHLAVNLKHYDEAYAFLKEGRANNPDDFVLNWETGYLLCTQKKYEEALPYLLMALKENEEKTYMDSTVLKKEWVLSRLVDCYMNLREWDEAEKYCQMWIQAYPKATVPLLRLQIIEQERSKKPIHLETKN